jgi:ectoine hydroxylase-related dioxygenase (phytanoyl-CoA dioxygenase family)
MALKIVSPATLHQKVVPFSLVLVPDDDPQVFLRQLGQIVEMTDAQSYDVVIVDRRRSTGITAVLEQLGGDLTVVVAEPTDSYADVCNRVATGSKGERMVFLGSDASLFPGWLRFIDEAFQYDPTLAIVRSADCDAIAMSGVVFAGLGGFNHWSAPGTERADLCFLAAANGIRVGFDRKRAMGASLLRRQFVDQGYVKLEGFLDPRACDQIVLEADAYYESKGVHGSQSARVMNFHRASPTAFAHLTSERFSAVLRDLFAEDPLFLQTILFFEGSEQSLHSDYIYMSTQRHHRMCGTWLALEDVHEDAGPLRYLPGSHVLPVESIQDRWARMAPEIEEKLARGILPPEGWRKPSDRFGHLYEGWEASIAPMAEAAGYKEQRLIAKKGDVLVWHANLIHGGTTIDQPGLTRRSLVAHYLTTEMAGYFDINYGDTQRPRAVAEVSNGAFEGEPALHRKKPKD